MYNLEELSALVEKALSSVEFPNEPRNLYEPIKFILSSGGKRIRPVFTLSACNLFKESIDNAVYPALAVEVFHNFTLMHDDIMDNADIRRGKETIHKKWDTNVAILSGDAMTIFAYKLLAKTESKYVVPIIEVFNDFSLGVCEGQQLDMDFEKARYVTAEEYTKMIELKTAVLLKGALQIGAIIGEAKSSDITAIGDFGMNLGIAFQLQDDLLDAYGDPSVFGKKQGGDIVANKKTILSIKAFNKVNTSQQEELNRLYHSKGIDSDTKISGVLKIFNDTSVKEDIEILITNYYSKAIESLERISVNSARKEVLTNLAHRIMMRNS